MTLGEQLKRTLAIQEEMEKLKQERKEQIQLAFRRRIRRNREDLTRKIASEITQQITSGQKPKFKVTGYIHEVWIRQCVERLNEEDRDLWENMVKYFESEQLDVVVVRLYDEPEMDPSIVIEVRPTI